MKNFTVLPPGARFTSGNMISGVKDGHDCFMKWDAFTRSVEIAPIHKLTSGVGITGIVETYKSSVSRVGDLIKTELWIDITGLDSTAQDGDIIGLEASGEAWIAHLTAEQNGTIWKAWMTCLEIPAGGDPNVALWEAVEATGVEDTLITALDETELLQSQSDGTDWATGDTFALNVLPTVGRYLYLVQGDGSGTDGTYSAGQFLLEFWGLAA